MTAVPRLSIGMPLFNQAETVEESVRRILRQTAADFELVISDNASTDGTAEICARVAESDRRVRLLRQSTNLGPFPNFVRVFEASRAPHFMWAAGDDLHGDEFAERCLAAFRLRPDAGLAISEWAIHGTATGGRFTVRRFPDFSPLASVDARQRVSAYIALHASRSHKGNFIYGVWRRELLADVLLRFAHMSHEQVYAGGDIAMVTYALTQRPALQVPGILFHKFNRPFAIGSAPHRVARFLGKLAHPMRTIHSRELFQPKVDMYVDLMAYALEQGGQLDGHSRRLLDMKRRQPTGS